MKVEIPVILTPCPVMLTPLQENGSNNKMI